MKHAQRPLLATLAIASLVVTGAVVVAPATPAPASAAVGDAETFAVTDSVQGGASSPFLTADAQRVVFTSGASDLVPGDTNGEPDVFLATAVQGSDDPFSAAPVLVSAPDGPVGAVRADGRSDDAVSSMNGRYVAFTSDATNLVDGVTPRGLTHVYVRDTVANTTVRLQASEIPDGDSRDPDMSDDGRYVVFTSAADNFDTIDANGAEDVYVADLDANGDGVHGDMEIDKVYPDRNIVSGTRDGVISGNGYIVAFRTRGDPADPLVQTALDSLFWTNLTYDRQGVVGRDVISPPSIDVTGKAFAYVRSRACNIGFGDTESPAVVAAMYSVQSPFTVSVGTFGTDRRAGVDSAPVISPDGSTVAWSTTVPIAEWSSETPPPPPLERPVIRTEKISWIDAETGGTVVGCNGTPGERTDHAPGSSPSLSATGRTLAFQSGTRIDAIDTHANDGISVSSTQGTIIPPSYLTRVPISSIALTTLRGYASALADAPVHRLPVHRLPVHRLPVHRLPVHRLLVEDSPVHRLPVHRLPVHRLPVHRLDIPGGWAQILEGTPFADQLLQTVTLDEVLAWAEENPDTDAGRLILSLSLGDLDIDGSGLDALTLASFALGSAPLVELPLPDSDDPASAWQELADAQGLAVEVDPEMVLADLDAAGLDIAASGVDRLVVGALPDATIDRMLLDAMTIDPALLPGTPLGERDVRSLDDAARLALFGRTDVSGTLALPTWPLLETATFADVAKGVPDLEFGELLFSLLDAESYPWEQLTSSAIDPRSGLDPTDPGGCNTNTRCSSNSPFRFAFDAGPGEPVRFTAPTARITLPPDTARTQLLWSGSSPEPRSWNQYTEYQGARTETRNGLSFALPDTSAGTVIEMDAWFSLSAGRGDPVARATLTTGTLESEATLRGIGSLSNWDNPSTDYADGVWEYGTGIVLEEGQLYYEWISPASVRQEVVDGRTVDVYGPADDEDFYLVPPPPPGKRLVISTNASDGQLALALFSPTRSADEDASLGVASAGDVPGTLVAEQTGAAGEPSTAGADTTAEVAGQTLIDQAAQRGDGTATVEAASTDAAAGENLLVRVSSGNGLASSELYSLRVRYVDEPSEIVCTPWAPTIPGLPTEASVSDVVTDETNTIYLFDQARFRDTYGVEETATVRAALARLTGDGAQGDDVVGAVLAIDSDPGVAAARSILDANPCSMTAREALSTAVNAYVAAALGDHRDQIDSVVIVGGDDIVPFAPVAQHTGQFNEASHSDALRLSGDACTLAVPEGSLDPCATPLSAAAATNHILTDDPYGLATAYRSLGGYLYVPNAALGRLVETPAQIVATIDRFIEADGVLEADSSLTGGYGAWAELPEGIRAAVGWRSPDNETLGEDDPQKLWTRTELAEALFPDAGDAPRIVSVNTHADETRLLPGVAGAAGGTFAEADLFTTGDVPEASGLDGSLLFLIGCHAGNNLPSAYYGEDAVDWVDVFSESGGFIGNTGYGLANTVTTALSERLLTLYADWVGVEVDGRTVTSSEALTYAKQSYLGGLGLYSGYDEKILMESVYYGLPMYTFADAATVKAAPVPAIPDDLTALQTQGGLSSASLEFAPDFQKVTKTDDEGREVSYLTADGQEPVTVAGQPVLPRIVSQLREEPGYTPRGVLITKLTSQTESGVPIAIAAPGVGVAQTTATRTDVAFPSAFATITSQQTPTGRSDLLVVTPGRVESGDGVTGSLERFTALGLDVLYAPEESTDTTAPSVRGVDARADGFAFSVAGEPAAGILLVQPTDGGSGEWQALPVGFAADRGSVLLPAGLGAYRWILQVADAAGNVTIETNRGHIVETAASAPELGSAGGDAELKVGALLQRTVEITDAAPGDRLTAQLTVQSGESAVGGAIVPVTTGADGVTRALIAQRFDIPGSFDVTLRVCRAEACTTARLAVDVSLQNTAPTSSVSLVSDTDPIGPSSVLTATAEARDADDADDPSLLLEWARNGVPIAGEFGTTLALLPLGANPGDVITVTATPFDGTTVGHASSASVTLHVPPPPPVITATATTATGAYAEGSWSRMPVTVVFDCSGLGALQCSPPETVSVDTPAAGLVVRGTVRDLFGRTATAEVLVRVDRTAPTLAPAVTPDPVAQGAVATAAPNAADAASGLASAACAVPQTSVAGPATVVCTAVDVAGNTATGAASYTVQAVGARMCRGLLDRTALAPLNADGTSVFLRTSGVPIAFRACDASGKPIGTKNFVKAVTLVSTTTLPASARINELWTPPFTGFTYLKAADVWLGQISTVKLAKGKKYTYTVLLADGTSFPFTFGVR